MLVKSLDVFGVRNLERVSINTEASVNCFYGKNGSGKTSLLEALFFLSRARSFRTSKRNKIILFGSPTMVVRSSFSQNKDHTLAIELNERGDSRLKLDGEELSRLADGTAMFPVQLITPESFDVFFTSPKARRSFLDFGLFHVEPDYQKLWSRFQKTQKQINALLRTGNADQRELAFWYKGLIEVSGEVDERRKKFVNQLFSPQLITSLESLELSETVKLLKEIDMQYKEKPFEASSDIDSENLNIQIQKDMRYKQVGFGPSKADLTFTLDKVDAKQTLSRGQSKMLFYLLEVAMVSLIKKQSGKNMLLLIDDLPSEVDQYTRATMLQLLIQSKAQIFVTGIENKIAMEFKKYIDSVNVFHVEHGTIKPEIME